MISVGLLGHCYHHTIAKISNNDIKLSDFGDGVDTPKAPIAKVVLGVVPTPRGPCPQRDAMPDCGLISGCALLPASI